MEQTNLWPRPIDEKNMSTEWIEDTFGQDGWLEDPDTGQDGYFSYITFIKKVLVRVSWKSGDNHLWFVVIDDTDASETILALRRAKAINEIKRLMQQAEDSENENRAEGEKCNCWFNEREDRIDFFFYFVGDE